MYGKMWEWVEDSWYEDYADAPADGSARLGGGTSFRVLRGGSWRSRAGEHRPDGRRKDLRDHCSMEFGFRLARTL